MMIILIACAATDVMAQEVFDKFLSFSWDVNIPLSNTNFIKKSSVKGFQVGYREKIGDHFYVGGILAMPLMTITLHGRRTI